jgi:WD40 repeat protein
MAVARAGDERTPRGAAAGPPAGAPQPVSPAGAAPRLEPCGDFALPGASGTAVEWSPDGATIAVAASTGIWADPEKKTAPADLVLYDAKTLEPKARWSTRSLRILCLRFSPDGRRLASVASDGDLVLWDVATQQALASVARTGFAPNPSCASCSWSPDGRTIAHADSGAVLLRETKTLSPTKTFRVEPAQECVDQVQISRDGKRLLAATNAGAVWGFEIPSGKTFLRAQAGSPRDKIIEAVGFGAGGEAWAAARTGIWGSSSTYPNLGDDVRAADFALDGSFAVLCDAEDRSVRRIDLRGRGKTELRPPRKTASAVLAVAISPDGKAVAWASDSVALTVWRDGATRTTAAEPAAPRGLAVSRGGAFVAALRTERKHFEPIAAFFDVKARQAIEVVVDGDGLCGGTREGEFASGKVSWDLWDAASGGKRSVSTQWLPTFILAGPWSSFDGAYAFGAGNDWEIARMRYFLIETATGKWADVTGLPGEPRDAAWSADGKQFAVATAAGWRIAAADGLRADFVALPAPAAALSSMPATSVSFTPSGKRLAVALGDALVEFDPAAKAIERQTPAAFSWFRHVDETRALAATAEGISLWDSASASATPLLRFTAACRPALAVDGSVLAVATSSRVWVYRVRLGR